MTQEHFFPQSESPHGAGQNVVDGESGKYTNDAGGELHERRSRLKLATVLDQILDQRGGEGGEGVQDADAAFEVQALDCEVEARRVDHFREDLAMAERAVVDAGQGAADASVAECVPAQEAAGIVLGLPADGAGVVRLRRLCKEWSGEDAVDDLGWWLGHG